MHMNSEFYNLIWHFLMKTQMLFWTWFCMDSTFIVGNHFDGLFVKIQMLKMFPSIGSHFYLLHQRVAILRRANFISAYDVISSDSMTSSALMCHVASLGAL